MNTDDLKQLIRDTQVIDFTTIDQDFERSLQLTLRNINTGETGVLKITPFEMILPDDLILRYQYQTDASPLGPPPEECLIADLKTNIAPAYEKGEVPFLFD